MARNITTRKGRRAVVIVEAAVAFTLLCMLVLGVIEFGWAILKSQQVTNAARQGARVGARVDATNADVEAAVAAAMNAGNMPTYELPNLPNVATVTPGEQFTITVRVHYTGENAVGLGVLPVEWFAPANLEAHVTMAKEGV
jgi:Flp pilus assembly protein TadG